MYQNWKTNKLICKLTKLKVKIIVRWQLQKVSYELQTNILILNKNTVKAKV
jgi:hypothetical protein